MNHLRNKLLALALGGSVLALSGCGGDPIIGTWRLDVLALNPVLAASVTSSNGDFTFKTGGTFDAVFTSVYKSTSATRASCTEVNYFLGSTWGTSTSGGVSTLVLGGTGTSQSERTGCTNPSDNQARTNSGMNNPYSGTTNYTISGNTLILTKTTTAGTTTTTLVRQ